MEYLRGNQRLTGALSAITAAVVGVILNLAIWFALHTIFTEVDQIRVAGVRLYHPDWAAVDPAAAALALAAFYLLFRRGWNILVTLGASAAIGGAIHLALLA
jgi:chromate transporter